jgi:Ca2+-binding RTX toxin-like protein
LTNADAITGGAGTDTIAIANTSNNDITAVVDLADVTGVERIVTTDANGDDTTTAESDDVSITFQHTNGALADDGTDAADVAIAVDGSSITDTLDNLTVDASNISDTDYLFTITGGAAADTLTGGGGVDTISGGAGADSITGGGGADTVTGGAGADDFIFALTDSTNAATDTITDFVSGSDEVRIAVTADGGNTYDLTNKGNAADSANALSLLSSVRGQYFFNTTTGQYVMDADGNGLVQASDFAVTLTGVTSSAAADVAFDVTTNNGGGAETITTGGGADTVITDTNSDNVNTGAGNDTVTIGTNHTTGVVNGGAGTDTLAFAADRDISGSTTISGFEAITLTTGSDVTVSPAQTVTFNGTDGFSVTGVSGGALETLVVASAAGGNIDVSSITFTNAGAVITGGANANVLTGGNGADTITGANGIDTLTGGDGIDTFVFEGIVAAANANNIQDFNVSGGDIIQLDGAVNGLADNATVIIVNVAGLGDVANQLIVDTAANLGTNGASIGNQSGGSNTKHQYAIASDTGAIYYDADGNWTGGGVQIGTIGTQTDTLTAANFTVA